MPKFRIKHGDFDISQVMDFFRDNIRIIYGDVLKHYKKLASGKQAICYLPGIEISKETAASNMTGNLSLSDLKQQKKE